ncbi:MAG: DNA adenine methylase [Acidobacteriota bacterium]|nr:MAG: DNA adenine methylase [Acidobacteriota bacterium]
MSGAAEIRLSPPDPHPFVKWAGGKGSLLGAVAGRIPKDRTFRRYVEPFVGAGAMFFWMRRSYPGLSCAIADSNEELMGAYRAIRDHAGDVLAKLETHAMMHGAEHFYAVRSRVPHAPIERAARFIYLNRTCYNGLYRVNRKGEFNVPIGRYENPKIVDRQNLLAVATTLANTELHTRDFGAITATCGAGDLVYLDPPYDPLSETSHFTSYTRDGFGRPEQERLAQAFEAMVARGASVILSNSDTDLIRKLYTGLTPAPVIDEVEVPRSINSKARSRGKIKELLIHYNP